MSGKTRLHIITYEILNKFTGEGSTVVWGLVVGRLGID